MFTLVIDSREKHLHKELINLYNNTPINNKDISTLIILGQCFFDEGNLDKAKKIFNDIVVIDNNNISALNSLGRIYHTKREMEKAEQFFLKALPTSNLEKFLKFLKTKNKDIKIYILSGGEKKEIELFLKKNSLISYFDEILASEKSKIDHLLEKEVSKNDIFIGDSKNDLKTSLRIDIKFILMEQYKSLNSFPSEIAVKENFLLARRIPIVKWKSIITQNIADAIPRPTFP